MAYDASKGVNNCYAYEHLGLYLVPEVDEAARILNKNTMNAANAIKAQMRASNTPLPAANVLQKKVLELEKKVRELMGAATEVGA